MGILYLNKSPPPSVFSRFLLHKIAMTQGFWLLQSNHAPGIHVIVWKRRLFYPWLSLRDLCSIRFFFFRHLCIEFNRRLWHIFWGEKIHQKSKNKTKKTFKTWIFEYEWLRNGKLVPDFHSMAMFYFLISNYWLI